MANDNLLFPSLSQFYIQIDTFNINDNKNIWKGLYNYIRGYYNNNNFMLSSEEIINAIINLFWDSIYQEYNNLTINTRFKILLTGIQSYSDELILECLIEVNGIYTMLFSKLPTYNNELMNEWFDEWYNIYIYNNEHTNSFGILYENNDNEIDINRFIDDNVNAIIIDDDDDTISDTSTSEGNISDNDNMSDIDT